jgi:hypothetical protein
VDRCPASPSWPRRSKRPRTEADHRRRQLALRECGLLDRQRGRRDRGVPSADVGSIGVYAAHVDASAAARRRGLKYTLISAGKFKVEGNPFEPLSDEARAAMQASVDEFYAMFTSDVAKNRDVSVKDVRNGYGEGRVLTAKSCAWPLA